MKNTAVFITKTSFGLDVDSKPPSASIAYDRVEGFYSPRFANGGLPPVAGAIQTDGSFFDRKIQQVYATGPAAAVVTDHGSPQVGPHELTGEREPMFFGTTTTTGLKVTFEEAALSELTAGYKRKEVSIIPLGQSSSKGGDGRLNYIYPSVIATLDNGFKVKEKLRESNGEDNQFTVAQYFATGVAAENLAKDPIVQAQFKFLAKDSLQQARTMQQETQRTTGLKVLECLTSVNDDRLQDIRANAAALKLLRPAPVADDLQKATPSEFRSKYAVQIMTPDPGSAEFTGRLQGHETYVCGLVAKKSVPAAPGAEKRASAR